LYPRQNPDKLAAENWKKQNKEPTMDPGEAAVLFGVVLLCLLLISGLMVSDPVHAPLELCKLTMLQIGTAWLLGAKFDHIFKNQSVDWPDADPSAIPAIKEEL
jgi:farnesyl-diphosphate farnesyltransferase